QRLRLRRVLRRVPRLPPRLERLAHASDVLRPELLRATTLALQTVLAVLVAAVSGHERDLGPMGGDGTGRLCPCPREAQPCAGPGARARGASHAAYLRTTPWARSAATRRRSFGSSRRSASVGVRRRTSSALIPSTARTVSSVSGLSTRRTAPRSTE